MKERVGFPAIIRPYWQGPSCSSRQPPVIAEMVTQHQTGSKSGGTEVPTGSPMHRGELRTSVALYQLSKVLTDSRVRNSWPGNHRLVGHASRLFRNDGQDARATKFIAISVITFENRYRWGGNWPRGATNIFIRRRFCDGRHGWPARTPTTESVLQHSRISAVTLES
jgi:hypothetical protein